MDIKQLKTFIVLASEQNYIKASEKLNYAPSTLAKHIRALENEFDSTFVVFSNGSIHLTSSGEKFLDYATRMLRVYEECETEFKKDVIKPVISVAGGELMVAYSFGTFFQNYQKDLTTSSIELNTICCAKVPNWLENRECDIGYVQMVDMRDSGNAKVLPLFQEKLCIMTSQNNPLAHASEVNMQDFENSSFAFTYAECCFTSTFRKLMKQSGVHLKSELFLGSVRAVVDSCLRENRLCLIPYASLEKIKEYGLVQVDWADAFSIYDCILTKNVVQPHEVLYPLIEASKAYCHQLKKEEATKDIHVF